MTSPADFTTLFETYYPRLYSYTRSQVPTRETAEDIVSNTFERAFSRLETYDVAKGAFSTWIFQIARNLVRNHYAAVSRHPPQYELDEVSAGLTGSISPEEQLLFQEQRQYLLGALAILSERDREIVQLKFFGRLTNRRIAEIMDLKEKTVSVIVLRALRKLKLHLASQEVV